MGQQEPRLPAAPPGPWVACSGVMAGLNSPWGCLGAQLTDSQRVQGRKVACLFSSRQTEKIEMTEVAVSKPGQPGPRADWSAGVRGGGRPGSSPGEPAERRGCFPEAPTAGRADAAGGGCPRARKEMRGNPSSSAVSGGCLSPQCLSFGSRFA